MREVKDMPSCQILYWLPVIEDDFGQERFFVEDPTKSFRSGNFNKVPVIAGRAEYEFERYIGQFLYFCYIIKFSTFFSDYRRLFEFFHERFLQ